jgi:DNA-binding Lrp family transcriptional regulator
VIVDSADRRLLDRIQESVPLVPRPFAAVGAALGLREEEVIKRLGALQREGVLRQIGGIFDTRACGYRSALVMARVAPERIESVAAAVGEHPGVTHCYERDHPWNLWFTVAVPPDSALGLPGTVDRLGSAAGANSIRLLPALTVFKIGAKFGMDDGAAQVSATAVPGARPVDDQPDPHGPISDGYPGARLSDGEIAAIRALQRPLSLVEEPFIQAAASAGVSQSELLSRATDLLGRGAMRRFAALLNHRRAGFGANVLGAWAVTDGGVAEAGKRIAEFSAVSHCYERPVFSDWPYPLLSMIHGRSKEECLETIDAIRRAIAPAASAALWSAREFKKVRLQLFTPDYPAWELSALGGSRPQGVRVAAGRSAVLNSAAEKIAAPAARTSPASLIPGALAVATATDSAITPPVRSQ